jgi:N-methylhydantoinase B
MPELDPIKIEVIRHGLAAAADEMALALQRAAYSTNIKTRQDFSCAIFDRQARIISQSFSQPVHLGSLTHFVPRILEEYGIDELQPGDGILCNDGHRGGVHLNDVCLVTPVFYEGELVAFVAAIAHHLDVGGGTPGSIGLSRDMYAEGLRIAPIRIMVGGKIDERVLRFITANVRAPRETAGDLRAQVAGVTVGSRRLLELIERNSWPVMNAAVEELLDYTERRVRAAISRLPEGSYHATGWMDSDGITDQPVRIQLRVDIGQNKVRFDLTGSDEQRPCPINATYAMSLSNCAYALRVLLDDDVPINAGFYRALELVAPPGTIVNAQIPAAVGGGWEMGFRVCETALQALASAAPERMAAGSKGCLCNIAFGGVSRREGERYVFYETMGGGYGARATKDGIDAVQPHGQNTENSPIEETEAGYPVRILRYEMVPDSEGAGRFRGGLGLRRDYLLGGGRPRPLPTLGLVRRRRCASRSLRARSLRRSPQHARQVLVRDAPGRYGARADGGWRRLRPGGGARPGTGAGRCAQRQSQRRAGQERLWRSDYGGWGTRSRSNRSSPPSAAECVGGMHEQLSTWC